MYKPVRYSFTGLFGEKNAGCGSLVDSYVDVRIDSRQSQVTSRILFQNNTKHAFGDAVYYARVAEGATITSVDCLIEQDSSINRKLDPACRLERREVRNASHEGSFFTCNLGTIESDREVVVFLRYDMTCLKGLHFCPTFRKLTVSTFQVSPRSDITG